MKTMLLLLLFPLTLCAAEQPPQAKDTLTVRGRITSVGEPGIPDGSPMPGAVVVVKSDGRKAVSDPQGRYSIAADSRDTLQFRFLGCQRVDVPVEGRDSIDVQLRPEDRKEMLRRAGFPQ